ncbi:MAG: membrane protein insertase YidC [Clostridiales bacterium]|nr:membrane protein insertase YidC [Clostridiales bacterium]
MAFDSGRYLMEFLYTLLIYPLVLLFEVVFTIANRIVFHPGFAIVVLSLAVNILVLPLYRRADEVQREERALEAGLKDGIDHIKKSFRGDERVMMLNTYYAQNGYSPMASLKGSLSLILQIPFFIAAYKFLSELSLIRGVAFGPIADLGAPDRMLEIYGIGINVLPILMTLINLISAFIYSRELPRSSKLQLLMMSLLFLVLLYRSPSGLVFYWTLNNIFSLGKNIVSRVRAGKSEVLSEVSYRKASKGSGSIFILSGLFLTALIGIQIPASVIRSSPMDFVDYMDIRSPVVFVVHSCLIAAGYFLIWGGVFFSLAGDRGRLIISRIWWALCPTSLVTYLFFGTKLGILTQTLEYEDAFGFQASETVINLILCIVIAAIFIVMSHRLKRVADGLATVLVIGCVIMGVYYLIDINAEYKKTSDDLVFEVPSFTLSTDGRNVMVIMLDRALGCLVPYVFDELPYLQEQFDGFTYYPNTISFGFCTKHATPALFGGYDYTPQNIAADLDKTLLQTQNEALSVMPLVFEQEGFRVTVCDPPYAGYQQVPDLSVFDQEGYEGINAYHTRGNPYFDNYDFYVMRGSLLNRNFFCYAIMKASPLIMQSLLYDNGNYNATQLGKDGCEEAYTIPQEASDISHAYGVNQETMNSYNILNNLSNITSITEDDTDTFMYIANVLTHSPQILEEPDYVPAQYVDNYDYDSENEGRFDATINGYTLAMDTVGGMSHYHVNAASYILLGQYFDYMRRMGVWDNTRIIIVSDHGVGIINEDTSIPDSSTEYSNIECYNPVLMVKDFDSTGFNICNDVMTNADVPYLASYGIVEEPVNPFTGNPIVALDDYDGVICVYDSWDINVVTDTGAEGDANRFIYGYWYLFEGTEVFDRDSWRLAAFG